MKKTLLLKVDSQNPEIEKIQIAADIIKKGGLVAFPTETVYGLGADALNTNAVLALFKAKKRPLDNPPIVHISNIKDIHKLVRKVPPKAQVLMKKFWPGPLTLILKRSQNVPRTTVCDLETIAVRMPNHKVALALIRKSHCSIAAPSANLAGRPSPTTAQHVVEDLDGRIDAILDAGPTRIGVESTVLDMTVDPPQLLRPGGVPYEVLKEFLGKVNLSQFALAEGKVSIEKPHSPGLKHKHYAPKADVIIVEGNISNIVGKVKEMVDFYLQKGDKVGVLATDETVGCYTMGLVKSLGSRKDLAEIARNLFRLLREFDLEGVDVIIAEGLPLCDLGLAVMNRLRKASGYKIVKANG